MTKYLVFTDLDGTLLDHENYRFEGSLKAITRLVDNRIPLIFCSSKSIAEQLYWQRQLNVCFPLIVENGSALVFPPGFESPGIAGLIPAANRLSLIPLTSKRVLDIQQLIDDINFRKSDYIRAYFNSSLGEITLATGLNQEQAIYAQNRSFTETILSGRLKDGDRAVFHSRGFSISQGGRFETIQDRLVNKGKAVRHMIEVFHSWWGERPVSFGVGDSPNDISMLEQVDRPFLVKNHFNKWCDCQPSGLERVNAIGPEGFTEFVNRVLG